MQSGARDRTIRFQRFESTRDDTGQPVGEWVDIDNAPQMWAEFYTDKGIERFNSDKKTATQHEVFKVRYRQDIREDMTILFDGRRFDITNIQEIQRRKGLRIFATWTQGQYE